MIAAAKTQAVEACKESELTVTNSSSSSTSSASSLSSVSAWEQNTGNGVKLIHEKKYCEALDVFLSLRRALDNIGENNVSAELLGSFYHCLGVCYQELGELFNAQTHLTQAYNIRKKNYGDNHDQTESSLRRLSKVKDLLSKRFIQVPQGRVARFIKGVSERFDVTGLCTNTFYNCNIIVFISEDRTKISLIHADAVRQELVRQEELWVGKVCERIVVLRKNKYAEQNFNDIFGENNYGKFFKRIEITSNTTDVFAVSISITDCLIKQYTGPDYNKNIVKLKYPIKTILEPIKEFNLISNNIDQQEVEVLQFVWMVFDGSFWCPPLENDMKLCKQGALIQKCCKQSNDDEEPLYKLLGRYRKKIPNIENRYFKLKQKLLLLITQHNFLISSDEYNYMIRFALAASSASQSIYANVKAVLRDIDVRGTQSLKQNMAFIVTQTNKLLMDLEYDSRQSSSTSFSSSSSALSLKLSSNSKLSLGKMYELVDEVSQQLLTSNQIIPRSNCPYYLYGPKTPKELTAYKTLIVDYRSSSATLIAERCVPNPASIWSDFSFGSFFHRFVGSLVVAHFGIGECAECSAILAIKLVLHGYGDITFVGITFPEAKEGMEQTHQFVIANLHEQPQKQKSDISIYDFFKTLPEDVIIGDPFLGLCFTPKNIPAAFNKFVCCRITVWQRCTHAIIMTSS